MMLQSCRHVGARCLRVGRALSTAIPGSGGESFEAGHVLITEQEQGNIVQKVQEAATTADLEHLERDKRWIHFGETMADLIVRESLEALADEREREVKRMMLREHERPAPGSEGGHEHDYCCGGGEGEVGAPGEDVEPAGKANAGVSV